LKKGRPILIEGRLRLDQWDDKQTGQKKSRLGVVLENFQFLDSGNRPEGIPGAAPAAASRPRPAAATASTPPADSEADSPPHEGDDVPF
jgi:single-strand DNA-binding protein